LSEISRGHFQQKRFDAARQLNRTGARNFARENFDRENSNREISTANPRERLLERFRDVNRERNAQTIGDTFDGTRVAAIPSRRS
jgi:hypothetical protein